MLSIRVAPRGAALAVLTLAVCAAAHADGPAHSVVFDPVAAAFDGTAPGRAALLRYLAGGNDRLPVETAGLATAVIADLARRAAITDQASLKEAVDRVVDVSSAALSNARIYHLGIEDGYRPVAPVLAADFGPVGPSAAGFVRVEAGDPRIRGRALNVVKGDGRGGVLGTGILGIERIELTLPEDSYRIVLLTRRSGRGGAVPFGRGVAVNGVPFRLDSNASEWWVSAVLLPSIETELGAVLGARRPVGAAADEFRFVHRMRSATRVGGAMIVEGWAARGKLVIELTPASGRPTYLTGLLVEPASKWSDLVLGTAARNTVVTLHQRLGFREQVLAAAAKVVHMAASTGARSARFPVPPPIPAWRARAAR